MLLLLLKTRNFGLIALAITMGMWTTSAQAVLQVYEGFNYPDTTSIIGGNGGGGWSDSWAKPGGGVSTETATAPGLSYQTVPVTGNKATLVGQQTAGAGNSSFNFRTANSTFGADGTTTWISMIGQRSGVKSGTDGPGDTASYQRVFGLHFFSGGTATANERFSIGELSSVAAVDDLDRWSLNIFNSDPNLAVVVPSTTAVDTLSFLLVRVDYGVGDLADTAYLWANPNLAAGEPAIGTAQATLSNRNLEFDRVRISAGGSLGTGEIAAASGLIDEIRIGTNFASVIGTGLIPGDVNGNGIADINDYNIIRSHFQMTGAARTDGDLNGDGKVNLVDFRLWKANRTAGAGAEDFSFEFPGSVPEPSAFVLMLLGAIAAATVRFARTKSA